MHKVGAPWKNCGEKRQANIAFTWHRPWTFYSPHPCCPLIGVFWTNSAAHQIRIDSIILINLAARIPRIFTPFFVLMASGGFSFCFAPLALHRTQMAWQIPTLTICIAGLLSVRMSEYALFSCLPAFAFCWTKTMKTHVRTQVDLIYQCPGLIPVLQTHI